MNGNSIFLDTNIILYLVSGDETLANLLQDKTIYISFITELELLGYKGLNREDLKKIEDFLASVIIIDINPEIKKITLFVRRNYKLKLPDAIIVATSYFMKLPLMTSDQEMMKISEVKIFSYKKKAQ